MTSRKADGAVQKEEDLLGTCDNGSVKKCPGEVLAVSKRWHLKLAAV